MSQHNINGRFIYRLLYFGILNQDAVQNVLLKFKCQLNAEQKKKVSLKVINLFY